MARILVVDDDPVIVSSLGLLLQLEGHDVFTASDGEEAIGMVHEHELDLVLLDLIMPVMDGREALSVIHRDFPELPVVIQSGRPGNGLRAELKEAGAVAVLFKPYPAEELFRIVEQYLPKVVDITDH